MGERSAKRGVAPAPDPAQLKRESAGRYVTADARFTVEQASGGWMVIDAEQVNELGLPLVRGPFPTLQDARSVLEAIRGEPAPVSALAARIAAAPAQSRRERSVRPSPRPVPQPAAPPLIEVREFRPADGDALRTLWEAAGLRSLGDDDASLQAFVERNPGAFLVAIQGTAVVGSAMAGWDGRRGWIYHVATAPQVRRTGLATRLVRRMEEHLRSLGCPKVNVIVRDDNEGGAAFWSTLGYTAAPARQMGRELGSAARRRDRMRR
jgi:ribosomal protein S18 acetylase RimI-like enzyme